MFDLYQLSVEMTPVEDFFKVNPPFHLDFRSLRPPLPRESPESHPSGGCGFFLEQPNRGFIYNDFNFLHFFFETLITGWLIRWPFIGGSTVEMWLDLLYSSTLSGCSLDRCLGGRTSNKKMWLEQDTFREQFWELGFKIWWYCRTQWNCETQAQRSARGRRHDSKCLPYLFD